MKFHLVIDLSKLDEVSSKLPNGLRALATALGMRFLERELFGMLPGRYCKENSGVVLIGNNPIGSWTVKSKI